VGRPCREDDLAVRGEAGDAARVRALLTHGRGCVAISANTHINDASPAYNRSSHERLDNSIQAYDVCPGNISWSGLQNSTKRGYKVVEPELRAEVNLECSDLFHRRRVLWIVGPPGSGKTTVTRRFQDYGFMTLDCEDPWVRKLRRGGASSATVMTRISTDAWLHGTTSFVFGACYVKILAGKPNFVDAVILSPDKEVYTKRWKTRNSRDKQRNDQQWRLMQQVAQNFSSDLKVHVIRQDTHDECVDATVMKICRSVKTRGG